MPSLPKIRPVCQYNSLLVSLALGKKFRLFDPCSMVSLNIAMLSETSGQLRRVLGVGFGLAVSIGGTQ
jgi:hypothetical protein